MSLGSFHHGICAELATMVAYIAGFDLNLAWERRSLHALRVSDRSDQPLSHEASLSILLLEDVGQVRKNMLLVAHFEFSCKGLATSTGKSD